MTLHLGDVPASSTLYIPFASYGSSGQSITLTGLAVTDIEIYKNGSVTQRASDAGYALLDTDGIDFDAITGIHGFSVDLSDNTDAGFYAVGSFYWVVISAVTIDSQTVNLIAATFRIVAAEAIAGKPKVDVDAWLGTAAATPTTAGVPEVDVTDWKGATAPAMTGDAFARLGAPAGASVSADIAAAKVDTAAILADTGTDGVVVAAASKTGYSLTATTGLGNQTADITGNLSGSVGSVTGAVGSVTGAVGSVTGNVGGNVTGSVGSVATGGIAATSFAAGAVDAAALAADAGTEIGTAVWASATRVLTANTNLNDPTAAAVATAVLTTAMTESYAADLAAPTLAQAVFAIQQGLLEFSISGVTITTKKIDKSTTAMTHTMDSATTPTSRTRAT